ncbi:MAG: RluA family pseudouridine synthase [Negativicutes bacterium]|nr:RluA family pseudouridine synthase [Negativicutes bacterium]
MLLEHTAAREGKLITFLRSEMGLSATLTKRLKLRNVCRVNGEQVRLYHRVAVGDRISIEIEEQAPNYAAEEGDLTILYEDEALLALDKPSGIIMHPTANRESGMLANRILYYYQQTNQKCAIHLINRLDRDTFGVVLIAKNAHIHAKMSEQLSSGRIVKTYHAAVFGHPARDQDVICQPIARLSETSLLRCVRTDGQYAKTFYRVLQKTAACSLLQLQPETGRTHQLRVHCASAGFPLLGDSQYGSEASEEFSRAYGYQSQQLCAVSLSFAHPLTGAGITVRSKQKIELPDANLA